MARRPATPIVVIGLDACEPDLLQRWARAGALPTLRRLLSSGVSAAVRNTTALHGGSAWSSFATGLTPAGHGRFCRRQAMRGAYLDRLHRPADVDGEQFWSALDAAGRRVAVLDVPHAKPSRVRGIEVLDWITHDPYYEHAHVQPAALAGDLHRHCPRPAPDECESVPDLSTRLDEFVALRRRRVAAKLAATLHCLGRERWDFFATVFGDGHCAGHRCWHVHDATHALHDPSLLARHGDPVREVYVELDAAVGRILEHVPPDATVIVLASHGMGPVHAAENVVLDDILLRIDGNRPPARGAAFRWLKRRWHALPPGMRESMGLPHLRRWARPRLHHALLAPDRRHRRFFAIPNDRYAGAVRINLKGRETCGVVEPAAYEAACAEVRAALLELVDVDTGEPVVREVLEPRQSLDGPHRDELPDLALEWRRSRPVRVVASTRAGAWTLPPSLDRTGDHRNEGLFVAVGPGLAPRHLETPVAIEDFAPTIAALAGVTLGRVDGSPIAGIVQGAAPGART